MFLRTSLCPRTAFIPLCLLTLAVGGCAGADTMDDTDAAAHEDASTHEDASVDASPGDASVDVDGAPGTSADACRFAFTGGTATGVGFPRPEPRLPSTGTVRAKVIFVDYPDAPAEKSPEETFAVLSPGAEDFYAHVSYGRLNLVLEPHLSWLRLGNDMAYYQNSLTTFAGHRAFIAEAVSLADAAVDFSTTDVVVVIGALNAAGVTYGPTWMGVAGQEIVADGRAITNGITSGADLAFFGAHWLNHEMFHSMGLPDLYEYGASGGFTRPFSVMDNISDTAPEPLAWERFQLGWLDDGQVRCNGGDTEAVVSPIEIEGGLKALMFRTGEARVVVVESRRALGYDSALNPEGVVVSVVDGSFASGYGPLRVLNGQAALQLLGSVEVDGLRIELLSQSEAGDRVRVTTVP